MIKILILFTFLTHHIIGGSILNNDDDIFVQVFDIVKSCRAGYSYRKATCITNYARQYGINPLMLARLGKTESSFRHTLVNQYSRCTGIYQISPKWWSHLIYKVQDGRYATRAMNEPHAKFLKFIAVNTEIACIILSNYITKYDGDYKKALLVFGGFRIKKYRDSPQQHLYIKRVLGQ